MVVLSGVGVSGEISCSQVEVVVVYQEAGYLLHSPKLCLMMEFVRLPDDLSRRTKQAAVRKGRNRCHCHAMVLA